MDFYSTNNKNVKASLKEAVLQGLVPDGGLYMPAEIPALPPRFIRSLASLSFQEISSKIISPYLSADIDEQTIDKMIGRALNFPVPLVKFKENIYALELFHGPTMAFKDFGARFMARLMSLLTKDIKQEIIILVATSGDTGSAVASGFYKIPGIKVVLAYPSGKVSQIQEKQLTTLGENITALEVDGTFDDCQKMIKQAFVDPQLNKKLKLTSANSINIARLLPQMCYYFYAYGQLAETKLPIVFSVPSGNFGNLTAGLFAKHMGLPISKFIAATNANDTVPRYLTSGLFEPKPSIKTISNAMDVGNPSNFARILELYNHHLNAIREDVWGASFSDEETAEAIKKVYKEYNYLLDPHSAVAYLGLKKYQEEVDSNVTGIFLATAHPAKFFDIIEPIINEPVEIPAQLKRCLSKEKHSIKIPSDYTYLYSLLEWNS